MFAGLARGLQFIDQRQRQDQAMAMDRERLGLQQQQFGLTAADTRKRWDQQSLENQRITEDRAVAAQDRARHLAMQAVAEVYQTGTLSPETQALLPGKPTVSVDAEGNQVWQRQGAQPYTIPRAKIDETLKLGTERRAADANNRANAILAEGQRDTREARFARDLAASREATAGAQGLLGAGMTMPRLSVYGDRPGAIEEPLPAEAMPPTRTRMGAQAGAQGGAQPRMGGGGLMPPIGDQPQPDAGDRLAQFKAYDEVVTGYEQQEAELLTALDQAAAASTAKGNAEQKADAARRHQALAGRLLRVQQDLQRFRALRDRASQAPSLEQSGLLNSRLLAVGVGTPQPTQPPAEAQAPQPPPAAPPASIDALKAEVTQALDAERQGQTAGRDMTVDRNAMAGRGLFRGATSLRDFVDPRPAIRQIQDAIIPGPAIEGRSIVDPLPVVKAIVTDLLALGKKLSGTAFGQMLNQLPEAVDEQRFLVWYNTTHPNETPLTLEDLAGRLPEIQARLAQEAQRAAAEKARRNKPAARSGGLVGAGLMTP